MPEYDGTAVLKRMTEITPRERLSVPPAEGDDPLVKATAVWDGHGSKVEVVHGGPIQMSGPHPQPAHADEVELLDPDLRRQKLSGLPVGVTRISREPDNTMEPTGSTCGDCGGLMRRTGACETCESCGTNTGCG